MTTSRNGARVALAGLEAASIAPYDTLKLPFASRSGPVLAWSNILTRNR
jgi:hypothetical protein